MIDINSDSFDMEEQVQIKENILKNPTDENLEIINFQYISSLPDIIQSEISLQKIYISNCPNFKVLFKNNFVNKVRYAAIINSGLKNLPIGIEYLSSVQRWNLSKNNFNKKLKWDWILKLQNLESLDLSGSLKKYSGNLPKEIFMNPNLKFLYLSNNAIKNLSIGIQNNQHLIELDLSNNPMSIFPEVLFHLTNLKILTVPASLINQLPFQIFELSSLELLKISGKNKEKYPKVTAFEQFFKRHQKKKLEADYVDFVLNIINNPRLIETLDKGELVELLGSGVSSIMNAALNILEYKYLDITKENSLSKDSYVSTKGKISESKERLKQRLEKNNIFLQNKINDKTTHLILGPEAEFSKEELKILDHITLLTEKLFFSQWDLMDKPFLEIEENATEQLNQIVNLINSNDDNLILVGLEILNSAGCPDDLLTDLFVLYKTSKNKRIKREALKFISRITNVDFLEDIQSRKPIFIKNQNSVILKNLLFYIEKYNLDRAKIAKNMLDKFNVHVQFPQID
jgi:hypothetical protein